MMDKAHPEALEAMRASGGSWAAYQNKALDSGLVGQLQFLAVGPGRTFETPPEQFPADTAAGAGWRYRFIGLVDLETGEVTS